jgi:hypothetical protein
MATAILRWKCNGCDADREIAGDEPEFYSDPTCCGGHMVFAGLRIVDVTPEAICFLATGAVN